MGAAAVAAARAIGCRGAGSVECVRGGEGGFYFREMNTRLRVEQPVTEGSTGQDFFSKQKTAYEVTRWLEVRRVLFRSINSLRPPQSTACSPKRIYSVNRRCSAGA